MKNEKQTKNPKKNRRAVRVALKRVLSADEIEVEARKAGYCD